MVAAVVLIHNGCNSEPEAGALASPSTDAVSFPELTTTLPHAARSIRAGLSTPDVHARLSRCGRMVRQRLQNARDGRAKLDFSLVLMIASDGRQARLTEIAPKWPDAMPAIARSCIIDALPRSFASSSAFSVRVDYPMCVRLSAASETK